MKIFLKTEDEISLMREANRLVGQTLAELAKHIKPGVSTLQLDQIAEEFIRDHGAVPTFKDFPNPFGQPFPASICTSVNEVVVHGIPRPFLRMEISFQSTVEHSSTVSTAIVAIRSV